MEAEPTSWQDWIAIVYACSVLSVLCAILSVVVVNRNYAPIRARNAPLLCAMGAAGAAHIVAALVCNEHIDWLSRAERFGCVAWNYWAQYFFGLFAWYVCVFVRLGVYGSSLSSRLSDLGAERARRYRWAIAPIIEIPIACILLWMTLSGASRYDPASDRCVSPLGFKLAVLAWVVLWAAALVVFGRIVHHGMEADYEREVRVLWNIVVFGGIVVSVNGFIVLGGLMTSSYARSTATINIATLHLFAVGRLAGFRAYRSIVRSADYDGDYRLLQADYRVELESLKEVEHIDGITSSFMTYCCTAPLFNLGTEGAGGTVDPMNMTRCHSEIVQWELNFDRCDQQTRTNMHIQIVDAYLIREANRYIHLDPEITLDVMNSGALSKLSFDDVKQWISKVLDETFGADFLRRVLNKQFPLEGQAREQVAHARKGKALRRLESTKLADAHSVELAHRFGEERKYERSETELSDWTVHNPEEEEEDFGGNSNGLHGNETD